MRPYFGRVCEVLDRPMYATQFFGAQTYPNAAATRVLVVGRQTIVALSQEKRDLNFVRIPAHHEKKKKRRTMSNIIFALVSVDCMHANCGVFSQTAKP
jgi:hypothetical protein